MINHSNILLLLNWSKHKSCLSWVTCYISLGRRKFFFNYLCGRVRDDVNIIYSGIQINGVPIKNKRICLVRYRVKVKQSERHILILESQEVTTGHVKITFQKECLKLLSVKKQRFQYTYVLSDIIKLNVNYVTT